MSWVCLSCDTIFFGFKSYLQSILTKKMDRWVGYAGVSSADVLGVGV